MNLCRDGFLRRVLRGRWNYMDTSPAQFSRLVSVAIGASAAIVCGVYSVQAQQTPSLGDRARLAGYSCIETGAHHRVWTRTRAVTNAGVVTFQTNRFRQLTTGLNRWNGQRWVESRPELIVTNGGVIGRGAQHAVLFAPNLNTTAAIQIKDSTGQWLKGGPLCLAYHDVSCGSNVYFAVVKDSSPVLVGSNRVVYPDAFDGGVTASVSFSYTKAGISQDIRFQARPPGPASFGLNPGTTHLLVISEFATNTPTPQIQERSWQAGLEVMHDQTIKFGAMSMVPGRAFKGSSRRGTGIPVAKKWEVTADGRKLIVERLQYSRASAALLELPAVATNVISGATNAAIATTNRWVARNTLPAGPSSKTYAAATPRFFAQLPETNDFVLDWYYIENDTDFVFGCETVVVDGPCQVYSLQAGPGCVAKYTPGSSLEVFGSYTWNTESPCGEGPFVLTDVRDYYAGENVAPDLDLEGFAEEGSYGPALLLDDCSYLSLAQNTTEIRYASDGIVANGCLPEVSVTATDPLATKGASPADTAKFTISRTDGDWSAPLNVYFSLGGLAISSDYQSSHTSPAQISAGVGSVDVIITPSSAGGGHYERTVSLTLTENSSYQIGSGSSVTAYIYDPLATPLDTPVSAPSGLVAWWRAENNTTDSRSQITGTFYHAPDPGYESGRAGKAFVFSGGQAHVRIADQSALRLTTGATIEAWINPADIGNWHEIASKWDAVPGPSGKSYTMGTTPDGHVYFGGTPNGTDSAARSVTASTAVTPGKWTHVAGTFDGAHLNIYVDGQSAGTITVPSTGWENGFYQGTHDFAIGGCVGNASAGSAISLYNGRIDEVSLYNTALSAQQIHDIFVAGGGGKVINPPEITTQPSSQTADAGQNVSFTVSAIGYPSLSYQWKKNGIALTDGGNISGATTPTLSISIVTLADTGSYAVEVSNAGGTRVSSAATLTVCLNTALAVNAYKIFCEDKFYVNVRNTSGVNLTGGEFDLFVSVPPDGMAFLTQLQPWGPGDTLANGAERLFNFCNTNHQLTNFIFMVEYVGQSACAKSPQFQIVNTPQPIRLVKNVTQMANPCDECPLNPDCPGGTPIFPVHSRPMCDGNQGIANCQPLPCGDWPVPLPASAHESGAGAQLDNFYKLTDPPQTIDISCPKKGFKNVYARKLWQGVYGPTAEFPRPGLASMKGNCYCQLPKPNSQPATTKYLLLQGSANWETHHFEHGQDSASTNSVSRQASVENTHTGKITYSGGGDPEGASAIVNVALRDLPGIYCEKVGQYLSILQTALPAPNEFVIVTPTFTDGTHPSMSWNYSWSFTQAAPGDPSCLYTFSGHSRGSVNLDLEAGTYSYSRDYAYAEYPCGVPTDGPPKKYTESGSIVITDTMVIRSYSFFDGIDGTHDLDEWGSGGSTVTYGSPYTSAQVNADCDALLASWDLTDDIQYPWRDDGNISSGPLVTYNERGGTPTVNWDFINHGTQQNPDWQLPEDNSLPPWPSQPAGAILGAPLPVRGPNGELLRNESYFNFYHKNYQFDYDDTGLGFVASHGAFSRFPNATQWTDDEQARTWPGGPFWAYDSELESPFPGDHFRFRLKDQYVTDTWHEWEQGGGTGGGLLKCKWAETLNAGPPTESFVFKDWDFDFRGFIGSYEWNSYAWFLQNRGDSSCPQLGETTPLNFTPISIPYPQAGAGYWIDPTKGSWWISGMHSQPRTFSFNCCQGAVYVQPNPPAANCNGLFVAMPAAVCDEAYGSLWMGRVEQGTSNAHECDNYVGNRNAGTASPSSCDPQIELDLLYHGRAGYETFVRTLPFPAPRNLSIDLSIDSDDNNGYGMPDGSGWEDQIEDDTFRPGKIVWVNTGDCDLDGVPDFADGFNWDGTAGNADDANTPSANDPNNRFVPVVLRLGSDITPSLARIRLTYSASDPGLVTHEGTPPVWRPAPGSLRLWKKNGNEIRNKNSAKAMANPGDFMDPGIYSPRQLGFSDAIRTVTLYLEGIQLSDSTGDQRILVEIDPDGDGPAGWTASDAVRITVIGTEFVEATGDLSTQPVSFVKDTHAAPYFDGPVSVILGTPQLDADGKLTNSIRLVGRIRSDLCDLVPGENGKIGGLNAGVLQDISISLNGEPLPNPTVRNFDQWKTNDAPSFTHPHATYTDFDLVFNDIEVSAGLNWLRLAVKDKVPGSGLTGSAEYGWIITPALLPSGPNGPTSAFQISWFSELFRSQRGEAHPYYLHFLGPRAVLNFASQFWPEKIWKGPNDDFFSAEKINVPKFHIFTILRNLRPFPALTGATDLLDEGRGYCCGIAFQAWDDIKGLAKIAIVTHPMMDPFYAKAYADVIIGRPDDFDSRIVVDIGTKAEQVSAAAQAGWNLWTAVARSEWSTIGAAARWDWDEASRNSETLRLLASYMVEAMVAINKNYHAQTAFDKGVIEGRVTFEVTMIILPFTDVAEISKVSVLTRLTEIQWIRDNEQLYNILLKVLDLVKATKPPPVIDGVAPPMIPALPSGTAAGAAAERTAGETFVQIQQAVARRQAFVNAVASLKAEAGAGVITIKFRDFQRLIFSSAPPGAFATYEDAAGFMANLLTYENYNFWKEGKTLMVVLPETGDGFFIPAGSKGLWEGNHIIKQQLQKILRDDYGIGTIGNDAYIRDQTPVQLFTSDEHRLGETAFHKRLNAWKDGIIGDQGLRVIHSDPNYNEPYKVVDEYIKFLNEYPEYREVIPVVRAFAKLHGIPITQ